MDGTAKRIGTARILSDDAVIRRDHSSTGGWNAVSSCSLVILALASILSIVGLHYLGTKCG